MRTIHVIQHRRPELLEPCLNGILNCQDIGKFDRLILSVDPGDGRSEACLQASLSAADLINRLGIIECSALMQPERRGCATHPLAVLSSAFRELGASLNVSVEDDGVLKADALRIALWFEQNRGPEHCLLGMCNHRDFGRGQVPGFPEDDPSIMAESSHIPSPFAWATTSAEWPFLSKWWNFKREFPLGWDWSLSMGMRLERRLALHPTLSRCQNIGREGGEHESPGTFDRTQSGVLYREEPYSGSYRVRAKIDRAGLDQFDDWMLPEKCRMDRGE